MLTFLALKQFIPHAYTLNQVWGGDNTSNYIDVTMQVGPNLELQATSTWSVSDKILEENPDTL